MGAKLLIAEDHEAARELIRHALDGQGYEIEFAHTGQQALDALERRSFDAVFLDLALPELTGSDVCRRVKADPARRSLPVILMSGALAARELAEEARGVGADAHLAKPFSLAELRTIARAFTKIHEQDRKIEELRHELEARRASDDDVRLDWNLPYHDFMRLARKKYFLHALALAGGNKSRLARRSGLDRSTLYVHFRNLGMMPTRKREETRSGSTKSSEAGKGETRPLHRHGH